MNVHLNPNFIARFMRPEEIALLRSLYQELAGTMAHERLYEHIAGR
jgi:hypothetical protein